MKTQAAWTLIVLGLFRFLADALGPRWRALAVGAEDMDAARTAAPAPELVPPADDAGDVPATSEAGFDRTIAGGETVILHNSAATALERKDLSFARTLVAKPMAA